MRYARHLLLDALGVEGQERLPAARVLTVGAGRLRPPPPAYRAAAGVGHLALADDDVVELSTLQRQILHTTSRIGRPKADSGRESLLAINPEIHIEALVE